MSKLPEVTITAMDRCRLVALATAALPSERDGVAASMLLSEIARATVVSECLPANVVGVGCRVDVRDNVKGITEHLRLVLPGEEDGSKETISVLTPTGAALLGLSEGASMEWCTVGRDRMSLTLLRVRD